MLIEKKSNEKEKKRQRTRENNQTHLKETNFDNLQHIVHQNSQQEINSLYDNEVLKFNYVSEEKFIEITKQFDRLNETLVYRRCTACRQVKLDLQVKLVCFQNNQYQLCSSCRNYSLDDIKQQVTGIANRSLLAF